jgi:hypothetical protein
MLYRVDATSLNLRSKPEVIPSTKIVALYQGQFVEKIETTNPMPWWKVSTTINSVVITGYVNSTFLKPDSNFVTPQQVNIIGEVHLSTSKIISRNATSGRAFPLNEKNQPRRTATSNPNQVIQLHEIINWLAVENSVRYLPKTGETYCNIYAYDYCYLSNVYIPRVWWTDKAISAIASGQSIAPIYDKTVHELNANSLHNWFAEYGDDFGWHRTFDLNDLQQNANNGAVCIISARRTDLNRSGHICAVAPEIEDKVAIRKKGFVTIPLQSNAGANNFRYGVTSSAWWLQKDKFSSYSFWVHA